MKAEMAAVKATPSQKRKSHLKNTLLQLVALTQLVLHVPPHELRGRGRVLPRRISLGNLCVRCQCGISNKFFLAPKTTISSCPGW